MVRKLLRMGADPNTQDYAGRSGVMVGVLMFDVKTFTTRLVTSSRSLQQGKPHCGQVVTETRSQCQPGGLQQGDSSS